MALKLNAYPQFILLTRRFGQTVPAVLAVIAVIAVLALGGQASAQLTVASDFRLGIHAEKTRLVIEMSDQVGYRAFALANPDRIVIDFPEIDWRMRPGAAPRAEGIVARFRFGLVRPGTSRVVLDLNQSGYIKGAFFLPPRDGTLFRFVLDIAAGNQALGKNIAAAPMARPGARPASRQTSPVRFPSPTRKPVPGGGKRHVIVIDPGHGGIDPGATGRGGIVEKTITLAAARAIKAGLERGGRYKAVLTRNRDMFIRLRDRVAFARDQGAELFISLHADTIRNKNVRGLSVYTLSERASDKEAAELAERENKADVIAGIDLSVQAPGVTDILIDLAQRESMNESARAAGHLVRELKRVSKLLRNTHRFAGFAVLKAPDVPSLLIEMGFLSNARDARSLASARYRKRLAVAVTKALDSFFRRVEQAGRP
jgi:N-acetylmuramoyl-L-alanine amidase